MLTIYILFIVYSVAIIVQSTKLAALAGKSYLTYDEAAALYKFRANAKHKVKLSVLAVSPGLILGLLQPQPLLIIWSLVVCGYLILTLQKAEELPCQ